MSCYSSLQNDTRETIKPENIKRFYEELGLNDPATKRFYENLDMLESQEKKSAWVKTSCSSTAIGK